MTLHWSLVWVLPALPLLVLTWKHLDSVFENRLRLRVTLTAQPGYCGFLETNPAPPRRIAFYTYFDGGGTKLAHRAVSMPVLVASKPKSVILVCWMSSLVGKGIELNAAGRQFDPYLTSRCVGMQVAPLWCELGYCVSKQSWLL